MTFNNVLLVGSTGYLGSRILDALVSKGNFNITLLLRKDRSSTPQGVRSIVVDFGSDVKLKAALRDQDLVIDATSDFDPRTSIRLMDAAVSAGVKRFFASEYSAHPNNSVVRSLPVFAGKAAALQHLQQLADKGKITYTAISNNAFLDWTLRNGFLNIDLANKKVNLLNDGKVGIYWTLLSSITDAVINSISRAEETKNRVCYIYSIYKSQAEMVNLAQEALGADGWEITRTDMNKVYEDALAKWSAGQISMQVVGDMIRYANATPDCSKKLEKDDNQLLGVKPLSDEDIKEIIKDIAKELQATK
ncbi:Bifunctional pinoresinol-lariciresinol reductase [Colletotrichum chlorophyti]|uniref:Bifunctional pinoresinol-lariciresinol reductase n=1 Tax=Colletotrichum chlorophyti TaxID=708187 RepID=A0A1Q8RG45_9PEZI|nr:Bifunctional pinoresinol-lariciresinol reductase [Colletotrichum chlorophyti]